MMADFPPWVGAGESNGFEQEPQQQAFETKKLFRYIVVI
jgi:hypothetical protein